MTFSDLIHQFSHLHTATGANWNENTRRKAPNKPFLLLALMDLFAQGSVTGDFVEPVEEWVDLFNIYWRLVMPPDRSGNFSMPFFHMRSEPFWELVPSPGMENAVQNANSITSLAQLRRLVLGARLAPELAQAFTHPDSRNILRKALFDSFFAPEYHPILLEQSLVNQEAFQYSEFLYEEALQGQTASKESIKPAVRDQGFRKAVVKVYDHRCAVCGVRMLSPEGHTAVAAAHIIPWSVSQDDQIPNGMALCHLCHWAFDEGLVSISKNYLVKISKLILLPGNLPLHLPTLAERPIFLPDEQPFWPGIKNLAYHARHIWRSG